MSLLELSLDAVIFQAEQVKMVIGKPTWAESVTVMKKWDFIESKSKTLFKISIECRHVRAEVNLFPHVGVFFSIGRVRTVPFLDKKYRAASATSGPALRNGPGCRISKSSSQSTRNIVLTHADSYWNYYFLVFWKITLNFPKSVK